MQAGHLGAQAHADLLDLPLELWPYELLASRSWQLRENLTIYDAAYVALAEMTTPRWRPSISGSQGHRASGARW